MLEKFYAPQSVRWCNFVHECMGEFRILRRSHVSSAFLIPWVIVLNLILTDLTQMVASLNSPSIKLSVKKTCEDWVMLTWKSTFPKDPISTGRKSFKTCDITYFPTQSKTVEIMKFYPNSQRGMRLVHLQNNTYYLSFMYCDNLRSNNVTFKTGLKCSDKKKSNGDMDDVYSTPTVLEEKGISQMSSTDVALGVFFGLFGASIIIAAGYYFWKNHQRRQRILRVFRQAHTDPFDHLQWSMEDSSVVNL